MQTSPCPLPQAPSGDQLLVEVHLARLCVPTSTVGRGCSTCMWGELGSRASACEAVVFGRSSLLAGEKGAPCVAEVAHLSASVPRVTLEFTVAHLAAFSKLDVTNCKNCSKSPICRLQTVPFKF